MLNCLLTDDDKENKIPPEPVERVRVDKEVDFIDKRQQDLEKEEAEFQRALEMSLLEEVSLEEVVVIAFCLSVPTSVKLENRLI